MMGAAGGGASVRAQAALRVPLEHARAVIPEGPLVALRDVSLLADDTGELIDLGARDLVTRLMRAFAELVALEQRDR
jgi:hypothetical protein